MEVQKKVKAGRIQLKNVPKHVLGCQPCSLLELTIMEQIDANQKTKAANGQKGLEPLGFIREDREAVAAML